MKLNFTLLIATLLFVHLSSAQPFNRCYTMEYHDLLVSEGLAQTNQFSQMDQAIQQWIANNPDNNSSVTAIPVVFHVLFANTNENIPDARIYAQLDVLNKDFSRTNADASNTPSVFQSVAADTELQFCLATQDPSGNPTTGIIRKSTTTSSWSQNNNIKSSAQGGADSWNTSKYLNIWIGNISGGVIGWATFPSSAGTNIDGVVVDYRTVGGQSAPGTMTYYNLGRTATHEVGHWLGLYHIWGDDFGSCSGSDLVNDTPNQGAENYGCPNFPKISCSNGPNGDMHMNFMDYSDDACMNTFTQGQKTRMQATINTLRFNMFSSQGCALVGINSVEALNNSISIFPNPSTGNFTLSTTFQEDTDLNIYIFNTLGEKIYQSEKPNLLKSKIDLDLNNFTNGIYYLVLVSNGFTTNRKLNVLR